MLARRSIALGRAACSATPSAPAGARNMATLRELELRLKSVRNIEKITKSMKMIASTKLAKAQRAMQAGKEYGAANAEIFQHSSPESSPPANSSSSSPQTKVSAAVSTPPSQRPPALSRFFPKNLALTFNQVGRDVPTFADAAAIADLVSNSGVKYDVVNIVYNKFVSAISYESAQVQVLNGEGLKDAPGFKTYEMEDDVTKDLSEFALANAIFSALVEGHACEISSRRNAMDNASKNAGDMIGSLTLQYNRGRQAAITNELVDIITGASAL
ncbi:ATP synthase F1 gamma [Pyrrhoderma noxium]|uniref:ATP synthase subunit gamma, mitochondrial n=1 Tax=Pyrrhoderma noxium TaxID=2282107 RepID=A0A286UF28_9AGAM|nr:ATP synthase F1 gamma [Pyrrhoderma noxium]